MAAKKKPSQKVEATHKEDETNDMSDAEKVQLRKLKDTEVDGLKGKLLEVRRIGIKPIYVSVTRADSIEDAMENADVPTDQDIKIEGIRSGKSAWESVELSAKAYLFDRIAITTKIIGGR